VDCQLDKKQLLNRYFLNDFIKTNRGLPSSLHHHIDKICYNIISLKMLHANTCQIRECPWPKGIYTTN